jgi:ABC-type Fe3+-hydroxamate transport system substrate-binding protein
MRAMATFRDVRGVEITMDAPPRRVVSLVPSITESLFDLGAGESVVAITDWCIFPADLQLPRVGGTKNPDVAAIRALRPDLVHMNLEENVRRHAEAIEEFARVFVSEPKTVGDVDELLATLGAMHACADRAGDFRERLRIERAALPSRSFTFAVPIWKNPWMWCGGDTYVSALVAEAGGTNVLREERRYPARSLEEMAALRPDVVFLPDEPYVFTADDAHSVIEATRARVIGPFAGHLFTWHGTRTIAGIRFLREALGNL